MGLSLALKGFHSRDMDLAEKKQAWERSLAQAHHFADTDNTLDAVARLQRVRSEIEGELNSGPKEDEQASLVAMQNRVARALERIGTQHAAWQARVEERARQFEQAEEEAYANPLPVKGIG